MNYAVAGKEDSAGTAADPRSDRVVVGLREGDEVARGALPRLCRRPARAGPLHPDAGPLHAGQHGQRSGALHRARDPAAGDRERAFVGRRALGLALCVWNARQHPRGALRGPAALLLRGQHVDRAVDTPVRRRPDVRFDEQVSRRPMEHRRLEGNAGGSSPRPAALAGRTLRARRRAGAEPQGVRPRMGAVVLDRIVGGELRSRANARQREGPRAVHPPLTADRREDRGSHRRDLGPADRARA